MEILRTYQAIGLNIAELQVARQNANCGFHNIFVQSKTIPARIYLLTVINRNNRTRCEICSKLTIKTPERRHGISIVNFEQVNADWDGRKMWDNY